MHLKQIPLVLFIFSLLAYTAETNHDTETSQNHNFEEVIFNWSRIFAQVVDIVHKKHYKVTDPQECMIKAIDGFVNTLDPHSNILDPKTYREMLESTSGEFFGIGIVIDYMRKTKDKFLTVVDTIPDGPADKAGIVPMDKIIEVDGQLLEGLSTEKIIQKIKGERNTKVTIKIMREATQEVLSYDIIRDTIQEQHSLSFHIKNHNISYISLSMFTDAGVKQIEELLQKSHEYNLKGLILDLRNNSGGLLTAAITIAGLFLKKNSLVVTTKDKNNTETERYSTIREPIANNTLPIFILINNYTASASEILAGCLKIYSEQSDNVLVFLVGTKTFGKGSVQEIIPIGNNCAIKITTSLYYLPNNTTIQGIGIDPDFLIERTTPPSEQTQWFIKHHGRENALARTIKIDNPHDTRMHNDTDNKKKEEKKQNRRYDRAKEMLQKDNQLNTCITLINMLHSARSITPDLVKGRTTAIDYLKQNCMNNDILEVEEVKV